MLEFRIARPSVTNRQRARIKTIGSFIEACGDEKVCASVGLIDAFRDSDNEGPTLTDSSSSVVSPYLTEISASEHSDSSF